MLISSRILIFGFAVRALSNDHEETVCLLMIVGKGTIDLDHVNISFTFTQHDDELRNLVTYDDGPEDDFPLQIPF